MADNNEFKVVFGADVSDAVSKIEQLNAAVARLSSSMQGSMSNMSTNVSNSLSRLSSSLTTVGTSLTVGLTAPLALFGKSALQTAAEIEQITISFEVFTGSAKVAGDMLTQLKEQALNSPMQFQDIAKGAQTLLGYGLTAEQVIPITKMLGDVSGGNADKFGRLALAFGQVNAAGRLMGQEARQMINAGFNPLQAIADKTGKSMAQLSDDMKKGRISVKDVGDAFIAATSEGGRFYGMAEKQADTLQGAYNKLREGITFTMAEIGQKIAQAFNLKEVLTNIGIFITHLKERFSALSPETQNMIIRVATITALAGPMILAIVGIINVVNAMSAAIKAARLAMIAFELSTGNIVAIGAVLVGVLGSATLAWYEYDDAVNAASANKKDVFSLQERNKQLKGQIEALKMLKALAPEVGQNTATGFQKGKKELDQEIARLQAEIRKNEGLIQKQKDELTPKLNLNATPTGLNTGNKELEKASKERKRLHDKWVADEAEYYGKLRTLDEANKLAAMRARDWWSTNYTEERQDLVAHFTGKIDEAKRYGAQYYGFEAELASKIVKLNQKVTESLVTNRNKARAMMSKKQDQGFYDFAVAQPQTASQAVAGMLNEDVFNRMSNYGKSFYAASKDMATNIASGFAEIVGTALFSGGTVGDAFKALGSLILESLGDYLIKIGTAAIAAGVVGTILKSFFTGGAATVPELGIAGGMAAVAVGGAMKALAGKVNASMDKNKSGAGISSSTGGGSMSSRISNSSYQYGGSSYSQQSVRLFVDLTGSITQSATGYSINKSMETTLRITGR